MSQPPVTLDVAIAAAFASFSSVAIAFVQLRLARRKLKLDLFDRRYEVYRQTVIMLENLSIEANKDELRTFRRLTHQAAFVFDSSITDYLKELDRKAVEMLNNQRQGDNAHRSQDHAAVLAASEKDLKLIEWIDEQSRLVFNKFLPYLDFKNVAIDRKKRSA